MNSQLKFRAVKMNYKLLKYFVQLLFELDPEMVPRDLDPIILDLEMYPNRILTTQKTQNFLRSYFDRKYFISAKQTLESPIDEVMLADYFSFKKNLSQKKIEKGTFVKLILDGELYVVNQIDVAKNKAVISKVDKNKVSRITLRVSLDNLEVSNLGSLSENGLDK